MKCYIARDCDGSLWMFKGQKPKKNEYGFFASKYGNYVELDNTWFPEVTFENSPQEVELKLAKKLAE